MVVIVGGSAVYVETVRVTAVFSDVLDIFLFGGRGILSQGGR